MKPKQYKDIDKFCLEYARTGNATQSAAVAGYSCPAQAGLRLTKRKHIQERINQIRNASVAKYADDSLVIAKSLNKKENWQSKLVSRLDDAANLPDFCRLMELFAKSAGHLSSDNNQQTLNILNISSDGFMQKAQAILAKLSSASSTTSDNIVDAEYEVIDKPLSDKDLDSNTKS